MKVGTRVRHNNEQVLNEGVVVHVSTGENNINVRNNKPFSVHWLNGFRGYYSKNEISTINPKSTLKQIQKELIENGE